jgi:DNA repair exonuclease SbcCD ATPase subunit
MEAQLTTRLAAFHKAVAATQQRYEYEQTQIERLKAKITQLEAEKTQLVKAVALIDRGIQTISANGIGLIESVVTKGLRIVFGDDQIGLVIEKKEGARGSSYRILVKDDENVGDPMKSNGGGVQNTVAFLLRLILAKRFKLAKLLVLDEQFNGVSPDRQPYVSELLHQLTHQFGYTILCVTHQPILARQADAVYRLVAKTKPPALCKLEGAELAEFKKGLDGTATEDSQAEVAQ